MSARELVVLGTASQAPTRYRNHNGYLLRWDGEGTLFDPGEGTQRQMILAGVSAPSIKRICITHFHGDHCLGLPGVIQRLSLDGVTSPIDVHFPASGRVYFDRLREAAIFDDRTRLVAHPVEGVSYSRQVGPLRLVGRRLDHSAESVGWRLEEPDGVHLVPERLQQAGIRGPAVGRLRDEGLLSTPRGEVRLEEVSERRRGQKFAFIMDTRLCDAAFELAADADLVVCESTFLSSEAVLAASYAHLTAAQAARIAAEAGARRLVLTHFSQRYADERAHLEEAAAIFPDVVAARDLDVVPVPRRTVGRS